MSQLEIDKEDPLCDEIGDDGTVYYTPSFGYVAPAIGFVPPSHRGCEPRQHVDRLGFHLLNISRVIFSFSTLVALVLAEGFTFLCIRLDGYARIHPNLFLTVLVFPLAFSINAVYQRRERAMDDLSMMKSSAMAWFFLHQEWHTRLADPRIFDIPNADGNSDAWRDHNQRYGVWHLQRSYHTLKLVMKDISLYLGTPDLHYGDEPREKSHRVAGRNEILKRIYDGFRHLSESNERLRAASCAASFVKNPMAVQPPILTRPIHWMYLMLQAFEKVRGIRDYRSPTTIRSFTKTLSWIVPMLLAPYFSWIAHDYQEWAAYFACGFVTVILGSFRVVQDFGENPFLPIGQHDIDNLNLSDLFVVWGHDKLIAPLDPPDPPSE